MTNDEISTLAVNALCDKIADMVKKGKSPKGLTEDEHAICLAHVAVEVMSTVNVTDTPLVMRTLAVAFRATKNSSQMRQVAEKRKILEVTQKGDKVEDLFSKYA
jgi:hypothetical protein